MTFVSIQQETLLTDIIKTWIKYLTDTGEFLWIAFKLDTPDTDIDLKLPLIVLKRVSNDTWSVNRNGWHFRVNWWDATTETTLYGYTYSSMIQFDIMTTTNTESNKIQGALYKALESSSFWGRTHIPLRTFVWVDKVWTPTDLNMKFYFWKDVDWAVIPSFDPNLHQCSVSVEFMVDCLSEVSNPKVLDNAIVYNINT